MTAGRRRLCAWGCCVIAACSAAEQGVPATKGHDAHDAPASATLDAGAAKPLPAKAGLAPQAAAEGGMAAVAARRPAFVQQLQLAAKDSGRTQAFGPELIGVGRRVVNAEAAELALDLGANLRIVLAPESELWALEASDSLLLVSGSAWVQRSPAAQRIGDAPVRLATSLGSLELTGPAEFWLRSESRSGPAGELRTRTQLALARGAVTWCSRGADDTLQRETLSADAPRAPGLAPLQLLRGTDTNRRATAFRSAPEQVAPTAAASERALEAALATRAAERARGVALLAQSSPHYARIAPPDTSAPRLRPSSEAAAVRSYREALASHAQRTHEARQLLRLATEQSFAAAALACVHASAAAQACAALERWREYVRPRLREAP